MSIKVLPLIGISISLLSGCSTMPQQPANANTAAKQSINNSETVSMLSLKAQLAEIMQLRAELAAMMLKMKTEDKAEKSALNTPKSTTLKFYYPFNGYDFKPDSYEKGQLLSLAKSALKIEVRGRTDGITPTKGDEQIAFRRAQNVKDYLIAHAVDPNKISISFLSAGDYLVDNKDSFSRAKNRRVEIEIFQ